MGRIALRAMARADIELAPDDGLNACVAGALIELDDVIHHAMVRDRHRRHPPLPGGADHVLDAAHPIQQAAFRVAMEVDE